MFNRFHQCISSLHAYYFCTFNTAFDAYIQIRIFGYTCNYLCTPLGINLNTGREISNSPGLACLGYEAWIEVEPSTKDQACL